MLRFAVNLLWCRPGKVGGTEPFIRNLLDGMRKTDRIFEVVLIVSEDNAGSFRHYTKEDSRFKILTAGTPSNNITHRIIWQNLHLNQLLQKNNLKYCFSPVYDRPVLNGGISYISVIHDIQAYHYPEYHPFYEVMYSKMIWKVCRDRSAGCVCISNFVKNDVIGKYHFLPEKTTVIYNPVSIHQNEFCDFSEIEDKYKIKKNGYFYTVGQLIPHKNIETLLYVMIEIVQSEPNLPAKLLVSGINGNAADHLKRKLHELNMENYVIFTGYVSTLVRNTLYKYARAFLFPSVFEGFGIPPVEAMMCGTTVITTKCASIPEVTQNRAVYVNNPYDVKEWVSKIKSAPEHSYMLDCSIYDQKHIAEQYLDYFKKTWKIK